MELQVKNKSLWSTFKNAYLRKRNLRKFWSKLDKINLPDDFIKTFDLYLNSPSYSWSSKFWRHLMMLDLSLIASGKYKNYQNVISRHYFTSTDLDEKLIETLCNEIKNRNISIDINLFKKQDSLNWTQSINHNLITLLLYENLKSKKVFQYLSKIKKNTSIVENSLNIDGIEITQDNLNSLDEYEKIEQLTKKINLKKGTFLEVGAGSGRTAKTILSINNNAKYVIADVPPAINVSYSNLKSCFPDKKIITAYQLNQEELNNAFNKNDILFIFPHQIKFFAEKTFEMSIAINCLHEMESKVIKEYMFNMERTSRIIYFKVWEYAGLPYSFYKNYSVHNKKDYFIKDSWKEHLKERCIYPAKYFHLAYEF